MIPMRKQLLLLGMLISCLVVGQQVHGQQLDEVVAVIDEAVILDSEIRDQVEYLKRQGRSDDGTLYCRVLRLLMEDKLLLAKARLDSLEIPEDQIESELNRRVNMMVAQMGGDEAFEEQVGLSVVEFRVEQRPFIEEQLLINKQRNAVYATLDVTPLEVREFYEAIPEDSLPYLPAEVEISQIILIPDPSLEAQNAAKQRLAGIRAQIEAGAATFAEQATRYSQDRGSAQQGGFLGQQERDGLVPEFTEVVFNLEEGQISSVFETEFGFHIAKLHKRTGNKVTVSHILIRPIVDADDLDVSREELARIREQIVGGEISFAKAAKRYSEDPRTMDNGGMVLDPVSGSYRIPLDQLDADLYLKIDQMQPGEISEPLDVLYQDRETKQATQLVYLRKRYPPHRATLETDYNRFYEAAKQAKRAEALERWFQAAKEQVYIDIKAEQCRQALSDWL